MKVQEVIIWAMAKKITWTQAGEIIGLCERQMRRWKERYQEFGYDRLFDRPASYRGITSRQTYLQPIRVPACLVGCAFLVVGEWRVLRRR